jgi:hypothetical protein
LNRVYVFTSDNLDYKTSDVYKPEKVITTPVKTQSKPKVEKQINQPMPVASQSNYSKDKYGRLKPTEAQIKMTKKPLPEVSEIIKDQIMLVEKQFNIKIEKKLQSEWDVRYISARRKLYPDWKEMEKMYGKPLSAFKVGDIVGTLGRNSDDDRYVILELTNDMAYILPYNFAYPNVSEIPFDGTNWELIEPKQDLIAGAKTYPKTEVVKPVAKSSSTGKNPSEFNIGDLIENAGVLYSVKTPKTKDNFTVLEIWNDPYRFGSTTEFANTKYTKSFSLVAKKSDLETWEQIEKIKTQSPAYNTIIYYMHQVKMYESAKDNNRPLDVVSEKVRTLQSKLLEFKATPEIQQNIIWKDQVDTALKYEKQMVDRINKKSASQSKPVSNKSNEDSELKDAIRGLEAFMRTSNKPSEKSQLTQAIKGLKALLK